MFRLLGHVIPDDKAIGIGLTYIYGIGKSRSRKILDKIDIDFEKDTGEVTEKEQKAIRDELKNYTLENDLKRKVKADIKRLKEIQSYRWRRHKVGLPVRGQSTLNNAETAKKLLGRKQKRPVLGKEGE